MKDNKNNEMAAVEMRKKTGSANCGFVLSIAKGDACFETRVTNVLIIQSHRLYSIVTNQLYRVWIQI